MVTPIVIPAGYYLTVTYILAAVVGLCVGSFLNVVIYRVPEGMSLASPPSHCPKCDYRLKWYDNIPILSYVILRGRCRSCGCHISFRYTAVEALNMVLWVLAVFRFHDNAVMMGVAMLASSLALCVAFVDLEHQWIPDRFQIILGALGVLSVFFDTARPWHSHLVGAAFGLAVFWATGLLVGRAVGAEALGGGDVKLALVSGLILGAEKLILMVLFASVTAGIVMICTKKKRAEREMAFGPFLAAGLCLSLFFGEAIIARYLSLLGF